MIDYGDYTVEVQEYKIRSNPGYLPIAYKNVYVINNENWGGQHKSDYQIVDSYGLNLKNYQNQLRDYGAIKEGRTMIFEKKEDAENAIEWVRSLILAMRLAGEL